MKDVARIKEVESLSTSKQEKMGDFTIYAINFAVGKNLKLVHIQDLEWQHYKLTILNLARLLDSAQQKYGSHCRDFLLFILRKLIILFIFSLPILYFDISSALALEGGLVKVVPNQRMYAFGFSLLPPYGDGWYVNELKNHQGYGFIDITSHESDVYSLIIRSGVTHLPFKFETKEELLDLLAKSDILASFFGEEANGVVRPAIVSRKETLAPEYGEYCVKGEYQFSGVKFWKNNNTGVLAQILSLTCVFTSDKTLAIDTKLSQMYVADNYRRELRREFDAYCRSIKFEKN